MKHKKLIEELKKLMGGDPHYHDVVLIETMYDIVGTLDLPKVFAQQFLAYKNGHNIKKDKEHRQLCSLAEELYRSCLEREEIIRNLKKEIQDLKSLVSKS